MFIKKITLVNVLLLLTIFASAQDEKGGKMSAAPIIAKPTRTYALVIGISKYESFRSLNYADKDATVFYDYLRSNAGGRIDSADIFFRTNEKAKAGDIWQGMSWLERRADTVGETAIIYFSGHGDAANAAEAYLLAYDAPNEGDPNMYNMGGTFQIYNLKVKIKKMVAKGVRVIFISDACRSNDLPGKETGAKWMFQSITEEKAGEIQMASCSSNEFSLEDKSWGQGRGVFSYWLLNGLSGMADNDPEDGKVSLYELERYVKDNVRKDTRSLSTGKPRQTPVFCCAENSDIILSTIDPITKSYVQKALEMNKADMSMAYASKKGALFADTVQQLYYKKFQEAIDNKSLLGNDSSSARFWFQRLFNTIKDDLTRSDLSDQYCGALINEAQVRITLYTKPTAEDISGSLNYKFFQEGGYLLKEASKYLSNNAEVYKNIEARRLFMEARALADSDNKEKLYIGLRKIDSSLALLNTAYAWHTRGMLLNSLKQYTNSITSYNKALELSKDWIFPIGNLGAMYVDRKMYDSALYFLRVVTSMKSNYANAYMNMAIAFEKLHQLDSSIYYYRYALNLSPNFAIAWSNYGQAMVESNKPDSALIYFNKAMELDPDNILNLTRIGDLYHSNKSNTVALYYYNKALAIDPGFADTYNDIGIMYMDMNKYDSAKKYFTRSIELDPENGSSWFNLGLMYDNQSLYKEAITSYQKALQVDSSLIDANSNLGNIFLKTNVFDSALKYYQVNVDRDPSCGECIYFIGKVYKEKKDWDKAIYYFKKAVPLSPAFDAPAYYIGQYYRERRELDSARKYLKIALDIAPEDDANLNIYGLLMEQMELYDSSAYYFKKCIELQPTSTLYRINLGITYGWADKLDSSLAVFNEVLRMDPNLSYVYSSRAEIHKRSKNYSSAVKDLEMLLKWDMTNSYAWNEAAMCLYYDKNYKKAITYYQNAIKHGMKPAVPLYNIACSYSLMHQRKEALAALKKSMQEGYNKRSKIGKDTDFEWLWNDAEFKALLVELGTED